MPLMVNFPEHKTVADLVLPVVFTVLEALPSIFRSFKVRLLALDIVYYFSTSVLFDSLPKKK